MSGFMKTVLKTACTKIAGMFLGNRSDSVNKYGQEKMRDREVPHFLLIWPCSTEDGIFLVYS